MEYSKPHLPYDQQLRLLAKRGLRYDDERKAIQALKSIGYYRLSAYTYVFRAAGSRRTDGAQPTRPETFVEGARFEDAVALCLFDHDLRLCLLDALQRIEVGMRVQIGYQLGKTDPFGHVDRKMLDPAACSQPGRGTRGGSRARPDAHEDWLRMYEALRYHARHEEYVKHFTVKYDGQMPVWVATELMTFGCLTYLYHLLSHRDADKIAANLGIRDRDLVHKWLKALNVLIRQPHLFVA